MVGSAGGIVAHTASRCSWGGIPTLSPQRTWPGSLFWSAGLEGAPSHCCTGDQMDGQILAHLGNPRTGALTYKVPWDPLAGLKPKPGGFPGDPGGPSVPSGGSCLQGHGGPMGEARGGVVWGPLLFWGGWPPSSPWWTDGGHQDSVRSKLLARHLSPGRKLQLTYVRVSARSLTTQPWPGSSLGPVDHWPHPAVSHQPSGHRVGVVPGVVARWGGAGAGSRAQGSGWARPGRAQARAAGPQGAVPRSRAQINPNRGSGRRPGTQPAFQGAGSMLRSLEPGKSVARSGGWGGGSPCPHHCLPPHGDVAGAHG